MKKVLLLTLVLTASLPALAQEIELNEAGAYEKKEVVVVDSVESAVLYGRAMEALSDWTGPDGNSRAGIDYQDKESGTVIYKGNYFLEYKSRVTVTADFTLKVRCKDGRSQITVTIPSLTASAPSVGLERSASVLKVLQSKKKSSQRLIEKLPEAANTLISAMSERLKNAPDDDF